MIRLILLDDHTLIRRGMRDVLEGEAGLAIVGEAGSGLLLDLLLDRRAHAGIDDLRAAHPDRQVETEIDALPGVIEWLPAFASVTVFFDPDNADPDALAAHLLSLARQTHAVPLNGATWTLPVCFDEDFGPDLDDLAARCGLDRAGVIARLTGAEFSVWMLGFLPGFPYLSGLPASLEMPRLATPRPRVPAGSVAIAGRMGAIYPWDSPGGWRLVGRTGHVVQRSCRFIQRCVQRVIPGRERAAHAAQRFAQGTRDTGRDYCDCAFDAPASRGRSAQGRRRATGRRCRRGHRPQTWCGSSRGVADQQ